MQKEVIEGYRLSPQQKHLWSLQPSAQSFTYRAQCALLIEGNLNQKILEAALQKVVNRHEILRTTFRCLPGMTIPLQVITDSSTLSVHYHALSRLDNQEQDVKIEALFNELLQLPINLEQDPLLHVSLIARSPDKHILLISLPAMSADTATIGNLVREISYSYTACLGNEAPLDEPTQYADVAEWQNELVEAENTNAGLEYWRNQDFYTAFNLKLAWENKLAQKEGFQPHCFSLGIPVALVVKLELLVEKYDVSIDIFLLTCWQILLGRITGEQNIIIGKVFDGRKYEELEHSIGLFAKYLPLSCNLNSRFKFSETLKHVRESVSEVYKWQEYFDWDKTVDSNKIDSAFFPFSFDFYDHPEKYCSDGLAFSVLKQYTCFDRFKVKLYCTRRDNLLTADFHYDSAVYSVEAIERLADQFNTLLESAINYPEAEIGKLEILKASEKQQLLVNLNQTQAEYPQDNYIHQLFEKQADSTPDQIAVVFEDQQLTYAELNRRANKIAHHLQRLEVGPEVLVGLFVERSLELIVGLLGILKAGGAYLPLDPALPKEGLAFRLQDAQVPILLTQQQLVETLPEHTAQVVCLDTDWEIIVQESQDNPTNELKAENLAYVLFTSGSTGKPKGVAVEHQQLLNYINAIKERLELADCSSFATVSTFAADLGNTTIFPSLCSGGCLHLVSQERASNPEALAEYFHRHPIDCLKIVPSHLAALLASSHPDQILPRQRLILGGEACSWKLIEQIQQLAFNCQIFNHYGPTETTVGVLTYPIEQGQTNRGSETVPIGRPIANTQIYLLDSELQPVPIGVPGELYVGGAGVARGYLNQPELTNEKFIPNPFAETGAISSRQRLYKTGDLARYLPDGNIEFIGRIDNQVKIHGFRIELGEIEAALRQQPAVRETVVVAREEQPGNKRLVAYVVPEKQSVPTTSELRGFLQEKLPEYMVPSAFVRLNALPLTSNGKVDRKALPEPDLTRSELEGNFVAPRTTVEKALAGIWAQILRLEKVGIYNNFFELGGDSILSMQIIAKANQAGLQLTPKQLFEHQTIAELAAVAGTSRAIQAEQGLVTGQVPLTPIQHWFFEQNLPDMHHWNQSILLEVRQAIAPALLEQAVQKLLEHHDALRLRFVRQESGFWQVNANLDEVVPFTCVDLSTVLETEQELAISAAAAALQTSLNLTSGPLVRVALFNLGASKPSRLLLVIHHLAVDGVSWRILLEDLQTAYEQLSQGQAIQLPPKTTSFKYWAERLTEYAQSEALEQLSYWLTESRQQNTHLSVDFPSGDNTMAKARTISVALNEEETQALLQQVPTAYQTQINDVLLAALVQAFEQWMGTHSLLIDLEGHGREVIFDDVDLSRTVGWFTTIFPVFLDIGGTSSPGDALKAVKEQLRGVPNRGIGYGVLRYLSGERALHLQQQPQAEIRFNYLGQSDQVFQESSLFALAQESSGPGCSQWGSRSYLLDINGIVAGDRLRLDWTYSEAIHQRSTIENLAQRFMEALRELIAHCQSLKVTEPVATTSKITVATLNAEAVLDPTIRPETSFEHTAEPAHIFLTGATGFVGAFLLYELLQQTNADIYCLVRSPNAELGKKRLQRNLESYSIWDESLSNRIIPVAGDLSQPLLGLSAEQFQVMAGKLDVIYHNAAAINLVYPYSTLKASNVLGSQEVLRLASQIKVKPVHYISTFSVLSSKEQAEVKTIRELHSFNHRQVPSSGYAQTKWVAEKLVTTADDRGIPVCIYRLGRVSGHSQTGVCNTSDRLYRTIKGLIQLECAPDVDTIVDMTPVDYVSKAIVHLSRQKKSLGQIFHLFNPHPIHSFDLFNWLREFGYPLQAMSYDQWQAELLNGSERSLDNPLYPLIPFFAGMEAERDSKKDSQGQTSNSVASNFACQNTTNGLADTSIVCPRVDAELLNTYFSYLVQSGFLNVPQQSEMSNNSNHRVMR